MNDDQPSSSAPAAQDGQQQLEKASTAAELSERRKKNRQMFNKKRGDLLDDLCRNLDIIIYAELSTVYYMDCSFFRFVIRAFIQFMFLTPKPAGFPQQPTDTPVIGALLGSNLLCLLAHIWFAAPSAGEATRGYLHGGVAMDFIGQKGPSSKLYLILLDLLIVLLQLVHLAANSVRRKVKEVPVTATSTTTATATVSAPQTTSRDTTQDLDSEERGVRRSHEQQDIEMQTLNPSGTTNTSNTDAASSEGATVEESSDRDALLAATTAPRTDAHIFDAFNSGQIVLADLNLWKEIKDQFTLAKEARNDTSSRTSSQALRAELAQRVLRMRLGTDALRQSL